MALTHAQRTSMFDTLAEVMGQDDAESLMEHLPPSGWDNVATKDGLSVTKSELLAALAEMNAAITAGFAQATAERAEIRAEAATKWAEATAERAEIRAEAAMGRAEIIRRQAWHLYIVVSTILVATISIWIALLAQPGAG